MKIWKLFILSVLLCSGLYIFITHFLYSVLIKNHKVNSKTAVIESWIPYYAYQEFADKYHQNNYSMIITTGNSCPKDFFYGMNGYLVFNLSDRLKNIRQDSIQSILVDAYGTRVLDKFAHFNLYVNDSLIGSTYTNDTLTKYSFTYHSEKKINTITVQFDNDRRYHKKDRDLFVRSIELNNKVIPAYSKGVTFYCLNLKKPRYIRYLDATYPLEAKNTLIALGIPGNIIFPVHSSYKHKISRTFTNAADVKKWLEKKSITVSGFNLFTMDFHSRRTWISYKREFGKNYNIGVIPCSDKEIKKSDWWKSPLDRKLVIREFFTLISAYLII